MRKTLILILLLCASLLLPACARAEGGLEVTFLNIGKADAILLRTANSAALIDTGTNKNGKQLLKWLTAEGVEALDLLVITHYDKDHVGGADRILESLPVRRVLNPAYHKDSKQYTQYMDALSAAGITPEMLDANITFELDGLRYDVDVANADFYGDDEENDFSLVLRVTAGERVFLFAGDAENPRLGELLDEGGLAADVLKVPHHGRFEDLSPAFFEAVGAQYGVITSSDEEPEDELVVELLREAGTEPLLTREGTVVITTDGSSLEVKQLGPED